LAQEIHVGPRLSSRQRHIGKHRLLGTCACGLAFRPKMRVPERTYTSLPVAGPPAPAGEQCDTSGQCAIGMQPTRLQLMMVAATIGSAIVGTLVLLTRAWPRQQQAVHNTSLSALMVKPGWPPTTDSQDEVTLKFPISFEDAYAGRCPDGFTCTGFSKVCKHPALTQSCTHPGIANVDGKKYLLVGNDKDSATATSVPFYLPSKITSIRWLRSGGSTPLLAYPCASWVLESRFASSRVDRTLIFFSRRCAMAWLITQVKPSTFALSTHTWVYGARCSLTTFVWRISGATR